MVNTRVRGANLDETFGMSKEQKTDETTVVELYLEPHDLVKVEKDELLAVRDPTVPNGIITLAPMNDPSVERKGNITATPAFREAHVKRMDNGVTPIQYATAHQDGHGDSTRGTVILVFHDRER